MINFERYLKHRAIHTQLVHDIQPNADLELIVVIPASDEMDYMRQCLASLQQTSPINGSVEILVVINDGMTQEEEIRTRNQECLRLIKDCFKENNPDLKILPVYVDISNFKKPGVGLARKIGMDEAIRRYLFLSKDGLIVCLDADCKVQKNYFQKIIEGFKIHPKLEAASLFFEHSFGLNKNKIIQYELHLRYFIAIQRDIDLPFAIQTIGSSMVVRASAYCKMGGMNTKQAGEDFYFLHKFISNNSCFEINGTTVYPSDRGSERVPFGTGKAINKLNLSQEELLTYHPNNFYSIKSFVDAVFNSYTELKFEKDQFSSIHLSLILFLEKNNFIYTLNEIKKNTTNLANFHKRFYQWFNAFLLMKCLHYLRDSVHADIPISEALGEYSASIKREKRYTLEEHLSIMREEARRYKAFL